MYGLALVLLTSLLVSGCGSSDGSGEASTPETTTPVLQPLPDGPGEAPAPAPGTTPPASPPPVLQPIPPPVATTRTWAVQGRMGSVGTFEGTFTYEKDAAPIAEHVRGLSPNAVYPLTAWNIEAHVHPTFNGLPIPGVEPVVFFRHTGFVDTSELCFNHCLFERYDASRLVFANGAQTLVLTFRLPAPHTTLPTEAGDWGTFQSNASYLQSGGLDATFQYTMVVTDSALVEE